MDDYLPLLLLIAGFFLLTRLMAHLEKTTKASQRQILRELGEESNGKKCPPHKWTYREPDGKMVCANYGCAFVAGTGFSPRE